MESRFRTAGFAMSILIHAGVVWAVVHYSYWNAPPAPVSKVVPFNIHMLQASSSKGVVSEAPQEEEVIEEASPQIAEEPVKPEPLTVKPVSRVVSTPHKKKKISKPVAKKPVIKRPKPASTSAQASQPLSRQQDTPARNQTQHTARQLEELRASYRQKVIAILQRNKFYPKRARRRHHEGMVELQFTIQSDGAIGDVRLIRASGHQSLDQAAAELLLKIGRFDPLPVELGIEQWRLKVPLQYKLSSG